MLYSVAETSFHTFPIVQVKNEVNFGLLALGNQKKRKETALFFVAVQCSVLPPFHNKPCIFFHVSKVVLRNELIKHLSSQLKSKACNPVF